MTPAVPFMASALLLLPLAGLGTALLSAQIATGDLRTYPILALNHLFTLGWGTLVAMGAIHQLFPALLGVRQAPGRAVLVQFGLSLAGAALLVLGFLVRSTLVIATGGVLAWAGAVLFIGLVARLVPRRQRWPLPATGVTWPWRIWA